MTDLKRQDDPSMDEILASIRRIIAEDGETATRAGGQDILDLTQRVEEDGSVVTIASRKTREAPEAAKPESRKLVSDGTAAAAVASLAELAKEAKEAPRIKVEPVVKAPESKAIEDMTRELLKPLLKSWLDSNLPQIIERVVREEIARLGREAQER
jgi:cell pole-organizing protein PopZ